MLINSINSALNGLASFESKMYESAQNISKSFDLEIPNDSDVKVEQKNELSEHSLENSSYIFSKNQISDLATNVVNMMMAKRGYEANLNVLKTTEDMSQSVINIFS